MGTGLGMKMTLCGLCERFCHCLTGWGLALVWWRQGFGGIICGVGTGLGMKVPLWRVAWTALPLFEGMGWPRCGEGRALEGLSAGWESAWG